MAVTDLIADFILQMLQNAGHTELQRAALADKFGCVPSQINYVIATRFTPEHGYIVESRRGGGGYIRISRIRTEPSLILAHTINAVGQSLDCRSAAALIANLLTAEIIDSRTAVLITAALSPPALRALPPELRGPIRASIFKQMLVHII